MARTARLALEVDSRSGRRNTQALNEDLRGLKATALRASDDLRKTGRSAEDLGRSGQRGARGMSDLRRETDRANSSLLRTRISASGVSTSLVALRNSALALAGIQLGRYFLDVTDKAKRLEGILKTTIPPSMSLATAQKEIGRIAAETRTPLNDIGTLYGRVARQALEMGKSAESAGRATETVAKALQVSGAGAGETASTIRQLSQALASGVLRGDEFNSIMENSPRLAKLLADSLDVSVGSLRAMAEEGELTADKLYRALTDKEFTAGLDREFAGLPVTFESAMTQVSNAAQMTFSAFDAGGQFSEAIVNFVMAGSSGFEDLSQDAESLGITVRSTIEGLGSVWDSFYQGGVAAINQLSDMLATLGVDMKGAFSGDIFQNTFREIDTGTNWLAGRLNQGFIGDLGGRARGTSLEQTYLGGRERSRRDLELDRVERDFYRSIPRGADYRQRGAAEVALELQRNPVNRATETSGSGSADRANRETGRTFTSSDLRSMFEGAGYRVTSGYRSQEEQDRIRANWDGKGVRPAAVSDHTAGSAIDIAKGGGLTIAKIRAMVTGRGGSVKQLLDEGDHFHLATGGKGGGKSEAEKALERENKLRDRRKELEQDFWADLKQSADTAGMLPDEIEQANAEAKLRNALNEGNKGTLVEISALQREQIANELARKRAAEFQGNVDRGRLEQLQEARALEAEHAVLVNSTAKTEQENMAAMQAGLRVKEDALRLGLDLTSETVTQAIAEAEARARTNADLAKKNQLIREGNQLGQDLLDRANPGAARQRQYQEDFGRLNANTDLDQNERSKAFEQLAREYEADMRGVAMDFQNEMLDSVGEIAQGFEDLFGEKVGNIAEALGSVFALMQPGAQNPRSGGLSSIFGGLEDLAGVMGRTFGDGKTGTFFKGLGDAFNKAGTGAAMGGQVAGLAKALGFKKFSSTGSQIGGAIGSFIPIPGGEIIGSILGGIVGGLFKKTKYGRVTVGGEGDLRASGNSKKSEKAALEAGNSLMDGLENLAKTLGGTVGSFGNITIGVRHGDWRVNTGGTSLKKDKGAKDFNDDAEAAVRYALVEAVKRGAITGLGATVTKILKSATDATLEKAVDDALLLQAIPKALKQMKDPVGAEIDSLNEEFKRIDALLDQHGGTLEEYAQAEELYQLRRAEIIKQGNDSALQAMRDYLFDLKGGTGSPLSPQSRYATTKAELDRLDSVRAGGGAVDFDQYRSVADAFLAASRDFQGSSLGYFGDLQRITRTVESWADTLAGTPNVTPTYPTVDIGPLIGATNTQTNVVGGLLTQIRDQLASSGTGGSFNPWSTIGGQLVYTGDRYSTVNV